MRIAVTGTSGQVAQALAARAGAFGGEVVLIGRPDFDLAVPDNAAAMFTAAKPDVIVSAAAYTAVDKAESEPELAYRINAEGAGAVARAAASLGVPLIHLSTDYVFDGSKSGDWTEGDATGPLGIYGATKLAGEQAVLSATADAAILRVAWVYAPFGSNFVRTMLRLGETRDALGIVADQIGRPTSALDIADAIWRMAARLTANPDDASLRGIFHMPAGGPAASWADFAQAIFAAAARRGKKSPHVERIATSAYPTPAHRPANSLLNGSKIAHAHGITLPDWRLSLETVMDQLIGTSDSAPRQEDMKR
ncbi:dTDP-4-dehydrorhamnose reductase [Ancylobacter radicis]|uniref:dTDP-4-dehydrorhamnose reductase n=1 Tax=Ancylobacter radicis TaxID=2836179 RepID=A0ABS5R9I8_9HYPH|nr:dTDP-4-dehydrorhamnose reductase [Ancylobacter radicis]MBS9478343.1 dTDP-4-dehydrorhamnose reductase [Ancylobacter radicis]